ncbi:hypothetical protein KU43P_01400 [Pseudomonas sp. KU43P]|nr:hypothetical protein KU43P_01400 [Pseudomonas sp. KU43P]
MISAPTAPENGRISKLCGWALSMDDKAFEAADIVHSHAVRDFMARNDQKRTGISRVGSSRAAHRLVDGYAVG